MPKWNIETDFKSYTNYKGGLSINEENKIITITGITENAISIDYSGDVDFTRLVSGLASFLDKKVLLSPNENNEASDDGSLRLILEIIEKIIEEFNNSVYDLDAEDAVEEEDDSFFWLLYMRFMRRH